MSQANETGVLTRERMLALALVAATLLALYVCFLLARPFLPALAWALALAVVADPLHRRVAGLVKNDSLAAALSVVLVAVAVVAPTLFVIDSLVRQSFEGARVIEEEVTSGRWRSAVEGNLYVAHALRWVESHVDLQGEFQRLVGSLTSAASSVLTGSLRVVVQLLITLFTLFYFFRDRRAILRGFRSLVPLSESEVDKVIASVADTIHAMVYGTVVVSMVQGILGGLMFWWLGLPAPALWGVVMGLLALVPTLGTFIVWTPAAVVLALQGSWGKALILAAWGLTAVSLIDNLLYPTLVGKRVRLHTLPVFFAIVGGVLLFGASGLILGPVALAVTVALLDIWRQRTTGGGAADSTPEI